jgi:hypothetical protein
MMGVHRGEQIELPFVDPEPDIPPDNEDEPGDDGDGTEQ